MLPRHVLNADLVEPSSPASARKMTSRSNGTFCRFSVSITISAGDDVVLVVHGSAAIDMTAVARGAERRMRPFLRVDVDDVGVAHDEDGPLGAAALEPREDVRTTRLEREDLRPGCPRLRALSSGTRRPAARCLADPRCPCERAPGSAGAFRRRGPTSQVPAVSEPSRRDSRGPASPLRCAWVGIVALSCRLKVLPPFRRKRDQTGSAFCRIVTVRTGEVMIRR